MRASVLFAAASWWISTFTYVAETGGSRRVRRNIENLFWLCSVVQPCALFQWLVFVLNISISSSVNICKDFQVSDAGAQGLSYAIAHICLHTYYMRLDKSSYWQQSTTLSLARGWETDTSKSADFLGLIRIFKGNFPQEKHFNTTSLMTHQHVGLCAAYVTFTCHN